METTPKTCQIEQTDSAGIKKFKQLRLIIPVQLLFVFSITIDQKGGHFGLPVASAFLLMPPEAVNEEVTLTCTRLRYKDPEAVKPREEDVFVSRILKIEPEGVTFKKPVTVLLSHSLCEDEECRYFYELIVVNLNSSGCQELETEQISSIEGIRYLRNRKHFPCFSRVINNSVFTEFLYIYRYVENKH